MEGTILAAEFIDRDTKVLLDDLKELVKREDSSFKVEDEFQVEASTSVCHASNFYVHSEPLVIIKEELPSPTSHEEACDDIFVTVGLESTVGDPSLLRPKEESEDVEIHEHAKESTPFCTFTEADLLSDSQAEDFLTDEDPPAPTKTRRSLTFEEKLTILDKIKAFDGTLSHRELAAAISLPKSTITRILKDEDKLREQSQRLHKKRKRNCDGKNPEVGMALKRWFEVAVDRGVRINGPVLKEKAGELASELAYPKFKASDGWLSRWKSRHQIKYNRLQGEKPIIDSYMVKKWKKLMLPNLMKEFSPDDIYNADETGLLFKAMPDGSFTFRCEATADSKKALDRISLLCCSNMSGNDKKKLLVVGSSAKPRCFEGIGVNSLPVHYFSNYNAWVTSLIFKEWITNWDKELLSNNRKILLFVDNCAVHHNLNNLASIRLEFLPANTTSLTQPMEMGIVKSLKMLYRSKLVQFSLGAIEDTFLTPELTAQDISSKVSFSQAIKLLADSWHGIKGTTIQNCFSLCGFRAPGIASTISDFVAESMVSIHKVINEDEFITIDNGVQCCDPNEQALVKQIVDDIKRLRKR